MEKKVRKIVCGGGHTGLITVDGDIYLMGRGSDGQLGRGHIVESIAAYRPTPTLVEYFKENNLSVENLALGANYTLVVTSPRV